MIANTQSFKRLKIEQQRILDFAVLICHAIPNVKKTIKGHEQGIEHFSLPTPDYFNHVQEGKVLELSRNYKANLAKYLIISSFSFFEAYFKSVIEELIEFQGGKGAFIKNTADRHKAIVESLSDTNKDTKRKLQEPYKRNKHEKYSINIRELESKNDFKMPSELFSALGIKYLFDLISSDRYRSVLIPELLENAFLMDLNDKINKTPDLIDKNLKETFNQMRDLRNRISHGDNPSIDFNKAMDYLRFLRKLSVKVDKHLLENYFILENINR